MANFIYDIEDINGVFTATDQEGIKRKQLHDIIDIFTYEPNDTLGTPANLKVVDRFGDSLELDINNTKSIGGVLFSGDFNDLFNDITALVDEINKRNNVSGISDIDEGAGLVNPNPPFGVWVRQTLDISAANKIVAINFFNSLSGNFRTAQIRAINDLDVPIWTGFVINLAKKGSTTVFVKTNSAAKFDFLVGNGVRVLHLSTFK